MPRSYLFPIDGLKINTIWSIGTVDLHPSGSAAPLIDDARQNRIARGDPLPTGAYQAFMDQRVQEKFAEFAVASPKRPTRNLVTIELCECPPSSPAIRGLATPNDKYRAPEFWSCGRAPLQHRGVCRPNGRPHTWVVQRRAFPVGRSSPLRIGSHFRVALASNSYPRV